MFFTRKYKTKIKNIENMLINLTNGAVSRDLNFNKKYDKFLLDNKLERMDANRIDLFDIKRCDFHMDRYRLACEYVENKNVLDIASGTGYGADILYKLGRAKHVFGVELNQEAVDYANAIYSSEYVEYKQGSILDIPFTDNTFDVLTSFETLEHIENEERQMQEIKRVLKKDGLYILSTPNDWDNSNNKFHVRDYDYNSVKELISKHFEIIKMYNQNSGSNREENHNMPRKIELTNENNYKNAECFVIIAKNNK